MIIWIGETEVDLALKMIEPVSSDDVTVLEVPIGEGLMMEGAFFELQAGLSAAVPPPSEPSFPLPEESFVVRPVSSENVHWASNSCGTGGQNRFFICRDYQSVTLPWSSRS